MNELYLHPKSDRTVDYQKFLYRAKFFDEYTAEYFDTLIAAKSFEDALQIARTIVEESESHNQLLVLEGVWTEGKSMIMERIPNAR